jgi:hypothetical protein
MYTAATSAPAGVDCQVTATLRNKPSVWPGPPHVPVDQKRRTAPNWYATKRNDDVTDELRQIDGKQALVMPATAGGPVE